MDGNYHQFSRFSLDDNDQKVQCIEVVLEMACVLKFFINENYFVPADFPFDTHVRRKGKSIKITMRRIEVTYDDTELFNFLRNMYTSTQDIPFKENLYDGPANGIRLSNHKLYLTSIGIRREPIDATEVKHA